MAAKKNTTLFSHFKILFVIIIVALIPVIMDQYQMNEGDVRTVGRVCAGLAAVFLVYGIFTKMIRLFSIVIIAIITLAVLISEGVIDPPHFLS